MSEKKEQALQQPQGQQFDMGVVCEIYGTETMLLKISNQNLMKALKSAQDELTATKQELAELKKVKKV